MKNRLVFKTFAITIVLIMFSFGILFIVQDYLINDVYIKYKQNLVEEHLKRAVDVVTRSEDPSRLDAVLEREAEIDPLFKKTFIEIYNKSWYRELRWINTQLLSSYYVEYNSALYKISVDKYTNMIYQKDRLVYDDIDEMKQKLRRREFEKIESETIWRFDGSEYVYLNFREGSNITIQVMYNNFDFQDEENDIFIEGPAQIADEIKGNLIQADFDDKIDFGYGYLSKLLGEKVQRFIVTNYELEPGKINKLEEIDPYTGIPYTLMIRPFLIQGETHYMIYLTSYDNLTFLNPLEEGNILILIASMVITSIVAFVYASAVTKPILEIRKVTHSLAEMDFSKKCNINTKDEIEDLGKDINRMATLLEIKTIRLNEEIEKMKKLEHFRKIFIAAASHEFRTPLTIIKGILEGYNDGIYEENAKEPMKIMEFEITELENIVNEIITISKNEANAMNYQFDYFQLSDLVQLNLNRYKYILTDRNIVIQKYLQDGFIYGDEDKISLVVKNVLSNAIKYSPQDNIVDVAVRDEGDKIVFTAENRGSKIDEETMKYLWEPFYRGKQERRKIQGFGIGLYTSKLILTDHNAEFGIENTEAGVRFFFKMKKEG
ncbi:MAG: HAMP domain-containing histidine kinase [Tissierellales bacterium]|nr:HAMP domain-containing histidine kinase [Tissierellales bacterium]